MPKHDWVGNHPLGLCMFVEEHCFLAIPKNASRSLKYIQDNPSRHRIQKETVKPEIVHVILRDPLERWISGFSEYLLRSSIHEDNGYNSVFNSFKVLNDLNNSFKVHWDEHTAPQSRFLLPDYNYKFWYLNHYENVYEITNKLGISKQPEWVGSKKWGAKNIRDFIRFYLSDQQIKIIKEYYKKDYKLIKKWFTI